MILAKSLGMIPSWQFQPNTINMNPHVQFPSGWNQLTPQPVGPFYAPPPEAGLGRSASDCVCDSGHEWCCTNQSRLTFSQRARVRSAMRARGISPDLCCKPGNPCCDDFTRSMGMRGLGISDIWATRLTIGGAVLAGVAAIAGIALAMK